MSNQWVILAWLMHTSPGGCHRATGDSSIDLWQRCWNAPYELEINIFCCFFMDVESVSDSRAPDAHEPRWLSPGYRWLINRFVAKVLKYTLRAWNQHFWCFFLWMSNQWVILAWLTHTGPGGCHRATGDSSIDMWQRCWNAPYELRINIFITFFMDVESVSDSGVADSHEPRWMSPGHRWLINWFVAKVLKCTLRA